MRPRMWAGENLKKRNIKKIPTIKVRFVHNLRFDDFLDDVFQSDDAHDFVERISFSFIIDPLHDSQMRFPFTVPEKDIGASWQVMQLAFHFMLIPSSFKTH